MGDPKVRQRVRTDAFHPGEPLIRRIMLAEPLNRSSRTHPLTVAVDPEAHHQVWIERWPSSGPGDGSHLLGVPGEIQLAHKVPDRTRRMILSDQLLHVDGTKEQLPAI